jgi:hypothetical protein
MTFIDLTPHLRQVPGYLSYNLEQGATNTEKWSD